MIPCVASLMGFAAEENTIICVYIYCLYDVGVFMCVGKRFAWLSFPVEGMSGTWGGDVDDRGDIY